MTAGEQARASIRVASYNLCDLLDDRFAAARVIRAIDPDILCLQEVPRRLLASRSVAKFARECEMSWPGGHRGSGRTTIFTSARVEVATSSHHRLWVRPFARRRGYAVTTVALSGQRSLVAVSVHLSLDAAERQRHAAYVLEALAWRPDESPEDGRTSSWRATSTKARTARPRSSSRAAFRSCRPQRRPIPLAAPRRSSTSSSPPRGWR